MNSNNTNILEEFFTKREILIGKKLINEVSFNDDRKVRIFKDLLTQAIKESLLYGKIQANLIDKFATFAQELGHDIYDDRIKQWLNEAIDRKVMLLNVMKDIKNNVLPIVFNEIAAKMPQQAKQSLISVIEKYSVSDSIVFSLLTVEENVVLVKELKDGVYDKEINEWLGVVV